LFLAEPPPTQWDLHFNLLGIRVRITPLFWVAAVLLGYSTARSLTEHTNGEFSVGLGLLIWTAAVLLSILVHEFGHALAFRYYGVEADVVLYHFGGLAIPRRSMTFGRQPWQDPKKQIVISIAGPVAQLLLGLAAIAVFRAGGFRVPNPLPFIRQLNFLHHGEEAPIGLLAFEVSLILASVQWALLNLLPIYPLDGGQIARELVTLFNPREGIRVSLILSIVTAGAVAIWGFTRDNPFMGLMFLSLAYSSYMTLQAYFGRGGGFGQGGF
jgi:Zn-dependent protease